MLYESDIEQAADEITKQKSMILMGGPDGQNGDFTLLKRLAETGRTYSGWGCLSNTKTGDEIWFYVTNPVMAIVACGTAMSDASKGTNWKYECTVGNVKWLSSEVSRSSMQRLFPDWSWVKATRGKVNLTEERACALRTEMRKQRNTSFRSLDSTLRHIVLAGPDTELPLRRDAVSNKRATGWRCGSRVKKNDELFIYFWGPTHAIVATATAAIDAERTAPRQFHTHLNDVHWLQKPITLGQMRQAFPDWGWTENCASRTTIDSDYATTLNSFITSQEKQADLSAKTPPPSSSLNGGEGGFGSAENNKIVEHAAVSYVSDVLKAEGFQKIDSREKDGVGYDLEATRGTETLHVEVKGTSGCEQKFILTAKEARMAKEDQAFRLFLVTEATTKNKKLYRYTGPEVHKTFALNPISYGVILKK